MADLLHNLTILLNNTGLQQKDQKLYQFLKRLMDGAAQLENQSSIAISEGITPLANADFLTKTNQLASLPLSWYLVAGSGITLDDSIPNQLVINASSGTGFSMAPSFLVMGG